ncbi:MAG: N-acetylmuramoyl-L-alanine amidase [Oscillospiraceae bacterium]|nr:N-acetylmuramoyl-L-alanine amidase [Oscillospiraceae bacterium]
MPLVYLSPSNQNYNRYICGDTDEAVQMRRIAMKIAEGLHTYGCAAHLAGETLTMEQRIEEANRIRADCYLSLHSSAGGGEGIEGLFAPQKEGSKDLCELLYHELQQVAPRPGRGVKDGMQAYGGLGYAELRLVRVRPVMLRVGFHDRPEDAGWICGHTADIASALATGLLKYWSGRDESTERKNETHSEDQEYYRLYIQYGIYPDVESAVRASAQMGELGFRRLMLFGQ